MTKDKLLEFYNRLKQEKMRISLLRQVKKCSDKELDIIMDSEYPSVMIDIVINYEFRLLKKQEQEEIIELINKAKNEEVASIIFIIVRSGMVLSSGLTTQIAQIIVESNIKAVEYVRDTALNTSVLINPNSLKLMKIIGSSKKEYQAASAVSIATNLDVLSSGYVVELTQIASQIDGEEQSALVTSIAKNRDVLSSNLAVKLVKLASETDTESTKLIKSLAYNNVLERNKRSVYYLEKMLEAKKYEEVLEIYNEAQIEIEFLKQQESIEKNDDGLFWNVYKYNSAEAIELLKECNKQEVTPHTRVRKKSNTIYKTKKNK